MPSPIETGDAPALELAAVPLPTDRTIDSISYVGLLKDRGHEAPRSNRSTFYYWGKNPSPAVGLHAVRHSTPEFGNWCVCNHAADQPA